MKKLAIVCGSPSTEMDAPFGDSGFDIWVLGNRSNRYPRFDVVFEIHDDLTQHGDIGRYVDYLVTLGVPLVVGEKFPASGENIEVFPYGDSERLFGSLYLTSSSAYMLCLALLRGYDHIELYGVDMAVDDHEYFWQRPCMEAWIGFAKGRGVTVVIPERSPMGKSDYVEGRHYGQYQPETPIKPDALIDMAETHREKAQEALGRLQALQGAMDEAEALRAAFQAHSGAQQAYERMAKVQRAVDAKQGIKSLLDTVRMQ